VSFLVEGEMQKLVRLEEVLHERVIGQDDPCGRWPTPSAAAGPACPTPTGPSARSFLGPTGVGKTELARALADYLFDDERAMVRIDMSEYMEKHAVARLIGAPPGYIGYDEGGQLTEAVAAALQRGLLDEIEKAHPDVFNVLLQVMDDGRLTDGQGRTVDFTNAVLIMTSNLPGDPLAFFKPEFVNRVDEMIRFRPLTEADLGHIVGIQLATCSSSGWRPGASGWMSPTRRRRSCAREGLRPHFGARPLKRVIQREIGDRVAVAILGGQGGRGRHRGGRRRRRRAHGECQRRHLISRRMSLGPSISTHRARYCRRCSSFGGRPDAGSTQTGTPWRNGAPVHHTRRCRPSGTSSSVGVPPLSRQEVCSCPQPSSSVPSGETRARASSPISWPRRWRWWSATRAATTPATPSWSTASASPSS
jgi:hypothetical protein